MKTYLLRDLTIPGKNYLPSAIWFQEMLPNQELIISSSKLELKKINGMLISNSHIADYKNKNI